MWVGASGAEVLAGASFALIVASDAGICVVVGELIGIASLHTDVAAFEVSSSAVNAVIASINASIAFNVAGNTESVVSEVVSWAVSNANSVKSESSNTACAVFGIELASFAGTITSKALID